MKKGNNMDGIEGYPQRRLGKLKPKDNSAYHKRHSERGSLSKHIKEAHSTESSRTKSGFKCSFSADCPFLCSTSEQLRNHLKHAHNFIVEKRILTFKTKAEFDKWRMEEEARTNSRYVSHSGTKSCTPGKLFNLRCQKSGDVQSEEDERKGAKPKRRNDNLPTICPSAIRVTELADNTIQATYFPDHLGHPLDNGLVRNMNPSPVEKQEITGELADGQPADAQSAYLLPANAEPDNGEPDNVEPDNVEPDNAEAANVKPAKKNDEAGAANKKGNANSKLSALQKGDIFNIHRVPFYCGKEDSHDGRMVHAWIKRLDLDKNDENPIVYYSPLNKYKDYAMILIHEVQKEVFMHAYDESIVYVKIKKAKPNVDMNMTSVNFLSASGDTYPIAFCISQKSEYVTLYNLYLTIHRNYGTIKPKFFVSDNLCDSYLAWKNVMGPCENQRICVFDLENTWQQKLAQHKVPAHKQKNASHRLRGLLYELNKEKFSEELDRTLSEWSEDRNMRIFTSFFQRYYVKTSEEWAACYRILKNPRETFDVHLEPLNGILDTIYVENFSGISLALNYLMAYIRDSCLLRLIEWDGKFRQEKQKATEKNHAEALQMSGVRPNGTSWVYTQNGLDYIIKRIGSNCNQDCGIYCAECKACVHQYNCICKDYVIGFNLCKHIHATRMIMTPADELSDNERMAALLRQKMREQRQNAERAARRGDGRENRDGGDYRENREGPQNMDQNMDRENQDNRENMQRRGILKGNEPGPLRLNEVNADPKLSAVSTAHSLMTNLRYSDLRDAEYRDVTRVLSMLQRTFRFRPIAMVEDAPF